MSEERTGLGVKFLRKQDDSETEFDTVAYVAKIAPPQLSRDVVEVESLNPDNQIKQKLLGLIDAGEMVTTLNYDPADILHKKLEGDLAAGVDHTYRYEFPFDTTTHSAGAYFEIVGIVTGFAPQEIAASNVIQAEVTITVSEKPEYTPAAAIVP